MDLWLTPMSEPDWKSISRALNAHLAEARLSSQDVAARAGVDRKTVDRMRSGRAVRPQTLQWVEQALGTTLAEGPALAPDTAPKHFGGYRREAVVEMTGEYLALRRSFDTPGRVIAGYLAVVWDEAVNALRFSESQDNRSSDGRTYTYRFGGDVLIPPNLGVIHFVVRSADGRVRTITTSMPREEAGTLMMRGFILTLNEIRDIGYYPVTSPICLAKMGDAVALETGIIEPGHSRYEWANTLLADIEQKFLAYR